MKTYLLASATALALALPSAAMACSGCSCSLSTDGQSLGLGNEPGLRLDYRFDYINQNQLRQGGGTAKEALPVPHETERKTVSMYHTLGIDYAPNNDWGINVQVPYWVRYHDTVQANATSDIKSSYTDLSDVRIVGRWHGLFDDKNTGLLLGAKLPTGRTHRTWKDASNGTLDASLQPGSGTTDLILGLTHTVPLAEDWAAFGQAQWQKALTRHNDFKPGDAYTATVGVRWQATETFMPQLQVNGVVNARDSWSSARDNTGGDPDNSGNWAVYLSPGLGIKLNDQMTAFVFGQIPVYQYVNGYQLAPYYKASAMISYKF